ncbi:DUF916 domain-containing protein [Agromyces albus]|uniref:DUF916 domain-containing protein n=2 Tax=Agromyces albus TaxID=205332 RepID=A0A4Q2L5Z4_9MICO|nr:DUF916 domain-containing protein [Agromyces albus]
MQTFSPRQTLNGRFLWRVVVAALAAFLLAGAFLAAPAEAAENGPSWVVDTADGSHGSGRQNYDYLVERGDRIEDALVVVNDGPAPIDLRLYAADAFTTETAQLDLRTREHASTGVGAWLRMAQERISLQPGESGEIPFTVTVPDDATPGDHMGGIVTTSASTSNGTEPERRAAIRVHLRVGDAFQPKLSVEDLSVNFSGDPLGAGLAMVTYTVRNTGDTMLSAEQSVTVAGPFDSFGVTAEPIENIPRLLPGEIWRVSVPIDGVVPSGLLAATVTVVPLYTDPAGSTGPLAGSEHTGNGWAIPWLLLILGVGALVAVVFVRKLRRSAPQKAGGLA